MSFKIIKLKILIAQNHIRLIIVLTFTRNHYFNYFSLLCCYEQIFQHSVFYSRGFNDVYVNVILIIPITKQTKLVYVFSRRKKLIKHCNLPTTLSTNCILIIKHFFTKIFQSFKRIREVKIADKIQEQHTKTVMENILYKF